MEDGDNNILDQNLIDLDPIKNMPVSSATAIGIVALNMALKYHDIGTVQDGVLYQQYKMEGKNLSPLHLDIVFETAKQIEIHILGTPNRLSDFVLETMAIVLQEEDNDGDGNYVDRGIVDNDRDRNNDGDNIGEKDG